MASPTDVTDAEVARFQRELAESLGRITDAFREALGKADRGDDGALLATARNLALARETGDQLVAMLGDAFTGAQQSFREAAANLADAVGGDLGDKGVSPHLSDVSVGVISALVGHGVDDIATIAGEAGPELRDVIRESVTTGLSPDAAFDALAGRLGKTQAQTTALADTCLMSLDRGIVVSHASEAGFAYFEFSGPRDTLTRPWCADRVGYRFTVPQMDREPSDVGPQPPSVWAGGYRCRHRWVPLDDSDLPGIEPYYDE